jgi:hypothetical protein
VNSTVLHVGKSCECFQAAALYQMLASTESKAQKAQSMRRKPTDKGLFGAALWFGTVCRAARRHWEVPGGQAGACGSKSDPFSGDAGAEGVY